MSVYKDIYILFTNKSSRWKLNLNFFKISVLFLSTKLVVGWKIGNNEMARRDMLCDHYFLDILPCTWLQHSKIFHAAARSPSIENLLWAFLGFVNFQLDWTDVFEGSCYLNLPFLLRTTPFLPPNYSLYHFLLKMYILFAFQKCISEIKYTYSKNISLEL